MSAALMGNDYEQATREFIEFVNAQAGAYADATSGFAKNKSLIERQVHRELVRTRRVTGKANDHVVMSTAVEDPSQPKVIMHRIVLASEYLAANSVGGGNEQQHARSAVIFIFAYWDEEIRPRMARARGVEPRDVRSDIFGDLRILRNAILHNRGLLRAADLQKLKLLAEYFGPDEMVSLPNTTIHRVFYLVKKAVAQMVLNDTGAATTAPFDVSEIDEVAIQRL